MSLTEGLQDMGSARIFDPLIVHNTFVEQYHKEPLLIRSPGRINLIGEHTDYNEGYVMPAAIDREIVLAIGFSDDGRSSLESLKHHQKVYFDVDQIDRVSTPLWLNYFLGVARSFVDKGHQLKPFHCIVDGDVPTGAGLSSSAAIECGFAYAINELHHFEVSKLEMVHMAQWAEHTYAGVMCGIMDQFSSMMGQEGKAFVLDCRSLEYTYFSLPLTDYTLVLCDTLVKHSLAGSEYNTRRQECEEGVAVLHKHYPYIKSLRDVTLDQIRKHQHEFKGKVFDRCRYIVEENLRVLEASRQLTNNDLKAFGQKMFESHEGLSKQYEVSCAELDFLVDQARAFSGILGSRMMGGGFGGCTINIVPKNDVGRFVSTLNDAYLSEFNRPMDHYVIELKSGTSIMNIS